MSAGFSIEISTTGLPKTLDLSRKNRIESSDVRCRMYLERLLGTEVDPRLFNGAGSCTFV